MREIIMLAGALICMVMGTVSLIQCRRLEKSALECQKWWSWQTFENAIEIAEIGRSVEDDN